MQAAYTTYSLAAAFHETRSKAVMKAHLSESNGLIKTAELLYVCTFPYYGGSGDSCLTCRIEGCWLESAQRHFQCVVVFRHDCLRPWTSFIILISSCILAQSHCRPTPSTAQPSPDKSFPNPNTPIFVSGSPKLQLVRKPFDLATPPHQSNNR